MDGLSPTLPVSYLLGSVPAVVEDDNSGSFGSKTVPEESLRVFPPSDSNDGGHDYHPRQHLLSDGGEATNNWKGVFNISSYTQYFNVDTDTVLNRVVCSLYPMSGDFFGRINANPDLYGLMWVTTTLVFVVSTLGNYSDYLMHKRSGNAVSWFFDVSYVSMAAWSVYGYAVLVPAGFYFLLQYLGLSTSLICFWCLWGYSLSVLVLGSFLMVMPSQSLRWLVILLSGAASSCFVASNIRSYTEGNALMVVVAASFALQMVFSLFIKIKFFS